MKNLAHLPLEKLEEAHSHLSMRWPEAGGHGSFRLGHYIYPERGHGGAWDDLYANVKRIILSSVGKNWDDVYSGLRTLVAGVTFRFDLDRMIRNTVDFPMWSYRNQQWETKAGHYMTGLTKYIQKIRRQRPQRWANDVYYYVCPRSNMLRLVRSKSVPDYKDGDFYRRHYKFITDRRREKKDKREARQNDITLKMINDPELYRFYVESVREYRALLKKIEDYKKKDRPAKEANYFSKTGWLWGQSSREDFRRLESLKDQIEELEAGNFDAFFESAVFLYSRHKECYHFKTP